MNTGSKHRMLKNFNQPLPHPPPYTALLLHPMMITTNILNTTLPTTWTWVLGCLHDTRLKNSKAGETLGRHSPQDPEDDDLPPSVLSKLCHPTPGEQKTKSLRFGSPLRYSSNTCRRHTTTVCKQFSVKRTRSVQLYDDIQNEARKRSKVHRLP